MLNLSVTKDELIQLHASARFARTSIINTGRHDIDHAFGAGYYDNQLKSLLALEEKIMTIFNSKDE